MSESSFFEESREQSIIKAEIVSKYFFAWANVIASSLNHRKAKIGYIDLFAGPGRYKDGMISTPIMVLESVIANEKLRGKLVTIFNDLDSNNAGDLQKAISEIDGIERLKYQPSIWNKEVGGEIVKQFESMSMIPCFLFIDPWGYKGLSLRLVNSVLKDWGSDCVFFFNYNRINMGISNPMVAEHMSALFGEEALEKLRGEVQSLNPFDREMTVINELATSLKEMGGTYVLPFCFKNAQGARTSHHLIFVSKHVKGYEIMKEIMAKYSSDLPQGVPSFTYNPVTDQRLQFLFELHRPLDELGKMLLTEFSGQTLKMNTIYQRHHINRPFIKKNYKNVLCKLEVDGDIVAEPPADKRRRNTFADGVSVTFPE